MTRRVRSGERITFAYDALNRPVEKSFQAGAQPSVYYGYDLLNRLLYANFNSATGPGVADTWDALGRRTSATTGGRTLSYQYDLDNNRTRVTWPDAAPNGLYVQYVYDRLNRVTEAQQNGAGSGAGLLATYQYDDLGDIVSIARAGGGSAAVTTASYDGADRLSAFTQAFGIGPLPEAGRKDRLGASLEGVLELFADRTLPFDASAARRHADLAVEARAAGRGFPTPDRYIAAIAASHAFAVASRDNSALAACGLTVIDPWTLAARAESETRHATPPQR